MNIFNASSVSIDLVSKRFLGHANFVASSQSHFTACNAVFDAVCENNQRFHTSTVAAFEVVSEVVSSREILAKE